MGLFINIRGTNGSGKTTLARAYRGVPITLGDAADPTRADPGRRRPIPGYVSFDDRNNRIVLVGPYERPTGGLDGVNSFEAQRSAVRVAFEAHQAHAVIGEGLLASGIFGSWGEFDATLISMGHQMAWCYLGTPLEECLRRVYARQAASGKQRAIKEDLVASKHRSVQSTRMKAIDAGFTVFDLPPGGENVALANIIAGFDGDLFDDSLDAYRPDAEAVKQARHFAAARRAGRRG